MKVENSVTDLYKASVIIIDDRPEDYENLRKILFHEGFLVSIFDCSDDAEKFAHTLTGHSLETERQIILASMDLIEESPLHLYNRLSPQFPSANWAFLSSRFQPEEIEVLLAKGQKAFFTKPLRFQDFMTWTSGTPSSTPEESEAAVA